MKQSEHREEAVVLRHAGVLSALLLTAALLCAIPGLISFPAGENRVDDSLRPAQLRTLTVWLMPGDVGDRKLLGECCAAFEKEQDGVRIFLRVVTADEFTAENAVLPDVALFTAGDLIQPDFLIPLADVSAPSGQFAGVQRAAPLWLAPNVLSIPQSWLREAARQTPKPDSLLAVSTPIPQETADSLLPADDLPWGMLLQKGAIAAPEGVGYQQLLSICPLQDRARLISAVLGLGTDPAAASPAPDGWVTTVPFSRSASPTPAPVITTPARVETLASHQARLKKGEALAAHVLSPAVSDRVRYTALCRDGEDARAFLQFLLAQQEAALSHGLIPPGCEPEHPDALTQALITAYDSPALPNAFAHTHQERLQLCADGFARNEDPVRTLLGLR